jgi:transcriptional regulator with XRE-family HTH domain
MPRHPQQLARYSGRNLGPLLRAKRITAAQLAAAVGCSESHLSRVLSGERLASGTLASRVAAVLGVPLFLAFDFLPGDGTSVAAEDSVDEAELRTAVA